jgi:hypothetical protein
MNLQSCLSGLNTRFALPSQPRRPDGPRSSAGTTTGGFVTRLHSLILTTLLLSIPVTLATQRSAEAQVYVNADVVYEPPAAYIATAAPEYYDGHPCYWYNNHWYYRDHGGWGYYRTEPGFLAGRRERWGGPGYVYGRPGFDRGGFVARGGFRGGGEVRGGGGFHGGGNFRPGPARFRYRR